MTAIARALQFAGGSHTEADIGEAVACGDMQRWEGDRSTIITEIRQTPRQRILLFFLAEGDMTELQAMTPGILDWGRMHGCVKAQLIGRPGWTRSWLVQDGWSETARIMERDL